MPSAGIFSGLVDLTAQSVGISLNHKVAFQERGFGSNCIEQLRPNETSRLHPTRKTNKATESHQIHFRSLLLNLLLYNNKAGKGILPNLNLSGSPSLFLSLSLSNEHTTRRPSENGGKAPRVLQVKRVFSYLAVRCLTTV